jgi:phospholipid/cholesterol/gamma-HCH transport system permease protein
VLRTIGASVTDLLADAGGLSRLAGASAACLLLDPFRGRRMHLRHVALQALRAGYYSLPLVSLIAFLIGMMTALESTQALQKFGANCAIPNLVMIGVTRELGPLITGIIVAGRFGAAVTGSDGPPRREPRHPWAQWWGQEYAAAVSVWARAPRCRHGADSARLTRS